jgi:hypothetical protein
MRLVVRFRAPDSWPNAEHFEQDFQVSTTIGSEEAFAASSSITLLADALRQRHGTKQLGALVIGLVSAPPIQPVRGYQMKKSDASNSISAAMAAAQPSIGQHTGVPIVPCYKGTIQIDAYESSPGEAKEELAWSCILPYLLEPERFPRPKLDKETWTQTSENRSMAEIPPEELYPDGWEFVTEHRPTQLVVRLHDQLALCMALQPVVGRTSRKPLRMYSDRLYGLVALELVALKQSAVRPITSTPSCAMCLVVGVPILACKGCTDAGLSCAPQYCSRVCQVAHRKIHAMFCGQSKTPVVHWPELPRLCEACGASAATGCGTCRMAFCSSRCYTSHALVHRPLCRSIPSSLSETLPDDVLMMINPHARPRFLTRNIVVAADAIATDVRPAIVNMLQKGGELIRAMPDARLVFASDLAATLM